MVRYLIHDGKSDLLNIVIVMLKSWFAAFILTPLVYFIGYLFGIIDRLILSEHDFMFVLLISIILDTFLGVYKHWKYSTMDAKKLVAKTFEKLLLVMIGMALFNSFAYSMKKHADLISYYDMMAQLILLSYPIFNAWKNVYLLSDKRFPPKWVMDRFTKFNQTGEIKQFYEQNNNSTNPANNVMQQEDNTGDNADSN